MLSLANEARTLFEQAGDDRAMMEAYLALADVERMRCQSDAEVSAIEQAVQYARHVGDAYRERELLERLGFVQLVGPTPVEQALQWLDEHEPEFERHAGYVRPMLEAMLGRFDLARALLAASFERMAEFGIRHGGERSASWFVETLAGDHIAAESEARRGNELLEEIGEVGMRSTIACLLAQSLYVLGRDREAEEWVAAGERLSASDDTTTQLLVRWVRAKLLARRGEHPAGERLAHEAVAVAEQTDLLNDRGDTFSDLAEVLLLAGRREDAARELEKALALYEQKGNLVSAGRTRERLAELRA